MNEANLLRGNGVKIGVLALQGAFIEHIDILRKLGVEALPVRLPGELKGLGGLIIPGGESTTMLNLMNSFKLIQPLREMAQAGLPIWGTCAGMICLAKRISDSGNCIKETLSLMDIEVKRNAFGRQVDSFEAELAVPALGQKSFHGVFIRAPIIENVGAQVEVLSRLPDGVVVAARQGKMVVVAFHPELTSDTRFHRYFLKIAAS